MTRNVGRRTKPGASAEAMIGALEVYQARDFRNCCGGEKLHWNIQISWNRWDAGLWKVDLKVPPAVDKLLRLLRRQRVGEMPTDEVKDCVTGLLAAEGVDRGAVPAV